MTETKNAPIRLAYLDMAKGLGIFLVTFGHITPKGNMIDSWGSLIKLIIFYIVGGYLMCMKQMQDRFTIGQYFKKLCRSIMVPYFMFSVGAILIRVVQYYLKNKDYIGALKRYLYATVTLRGISAMWFLPSLVIAELVFLAVLRSRKKSLLVFTMIWPLVLAFWIPGVLEGWEKTMSEKTYLLVSYPILTVAKGLVSVWFVEVGYLGYLVLKKIQGRSLRLGIGIFCTAAAMAMVRPASGIDYNMMSWGKQPLFLFLGGVLGSFGAILIFQFVEKYVKLELLTYYGKNSLVLMATQRGLLVIDLCLAGWMEVFRMEKAVTPLYYLENLVVLGLVLLMEYGMIEFINQKVPFIVGKRKQQKL